VIPEGKRKKYFKFCYSHTLFYNLESFTYFVQYLAQKVHNSEHKILLLTRIAMVIKIPEEEFYLVQTLTKKCQDWKCYGLLQSRSAGDN